MRSIAFPLLLASVPLVALTGCAPSTASFEDTVLRNVVLSESESADTSTAERRTTEQSTSDLRQRIENVLSDSLQRRSLDSGDNAAWQIMHAVICFGRDLQIDTPDRGRVSALDYVFSNGQVNGFELMMGTEQLPTTGKVGLKSRFNPGSYIGQGHVDQWLAICAMANVPMTTKIQVGETVCTLEDWARQTQYDVPENPIDEYSWTLIALTHYFPNEPQWATKNNIDVNWELLVGEELRQDIGLSACGGTHRLAGIVRALNAKTQLELPDSEVWNEARRMVDQLYADAKQNRGPDGRLSSFYFSRPGITRDLFAELSSTGHVFEFVALAAPDSELADEWIATAAHRLCELLESTIEEDLECGALYHALSGLKVYYDRRFKT